MAEYVSPTSMQDYRKNGENSGSQVSSSNPRQGNITPIGKRQQAKKSRSKNSKQPIGQSPISTIKLGTNQVGIEPNSSVSRELLTRSAMQQLALNIQRERMSSLIFGNRSKRTDKSPEISNSEKSTSTDMELPTKPKKILVESWDVTVSRTESSSFGEQV